MNQRTTLKSKLKKADNRLGAPLSALLQHYRTFNSSLSAAFREEIETHRGLFRFQLERHKRRKQYKNSGFNIETHTPVLEKLRTDGFAIVKGAMDKSLLLEIKRELERHLNSGTKLSKVSRDSARPAAMSINKSLKATLITAGLLINGSTIET